MSALSKRLLQHCRTVPRRLGRLSETIMTQRSAPGKWSPKEIIGHLIDSAANNHQRFVRAQRGEVPVIGYEQDDWVQIEGFQAENTQDLIRLWAYYNRHLAHIISRIPAEKLANTLVMGGQEVTLLWCIEDYVKHLEHHLAAIPFE